MSAGTDFDTAGVRRMLARSNYSIPPGPLPDADREAQALAMAADTDLTLTEARQAVTYVHDVLVPGFRELSATIGRSLRKMSDALTPLAQAANRAAAALNELPAARPDLDDRPPAIEFAADGDRAILTITTGPVPAMTLDEDVVVTSVRTFAGDLVAATLTSPNVRGSLTLHPDTIVASDRLPAIHLLPAVLYLEPRAGTPVPVAEVLRAIDRDDT